MTGPHAGGCACGAVRYTVRGALTPVACCHCESCRRQSGHFVAATTARLAEVDISGGDNLAVWRASDEAARRFCRVCGSLLFWQATGSDEIGIMAGTLDMPSGLDTTHHIYVAEKGDYYRLDDGLPQFPGTS